jgi:hypothetical protein
MIEFIAQNMAPIMFLGLVVFLIIGYPAAFALAANGLLFFWIGVELAPYSNGQISLSWPFFMDAFENLEQSSNAGGLIRWPAKFLIPVGFALLVAAGLSHLIKCVGCLRGLCPDPRDTHPGKSAEEELADEIAREAEQREAASHGER